MCEICSKVDFTEESLEMILDDMLIRKHIEILKEDGLVAENFFNRPEKEQITGARLSILILAVAELAYKYGLHPNELYQGVEIGVKRVALKVFLRANGLIDEQHDQLNDLQS